MFHILAYVDCSMYGILSFFVAIKLISAREKQKLNKIHNFSLDFFVRRTSNKLEMLPEMHWIRFKSCKYWPWQHPNIEKKKQVENRIGRSKQMS